MCLANFADDAGVNPFADLADAFAGVALVTHLGDDLEFAGAFGEPTGFEDGVRDRLLDIDVLAFAHAGHADEGMRVVGRRDDHAVNILTLLEHLTEVGEEFGLRELLNRPRAALEVEVAHRDDVLIGTVTDVAAADAPEADDSDVKFLVGRDGPRGGTGERAKGGHACGEEAGVLEEGATGEHDGGGVPFKQPPSPTVPSPDVKRP